MEKKHVCSDLIRLVILAGLLALLSGCAGRLQPVQSPAEATPPPSGAAQWQALGQVRQDDWFHVLNLGSEALDWRLRAIDSAVGSIDLQTFIWELEGSGDLIQSHLLAAAERGVWVRILVDDSFILDADPDLLEMDQHPGIELKVFNPYKRRSSQVALRETLNLGEFHRLDHRMHNKVMVVDNRVAVVGGRNLADHYFGFDASDNFRDMELVAGGEVVRKLAKAFDVYWNDVWSFPVTAIMDQRAGPGSPALIEATTGLQSEDYGHFEQSADQRMQAWKKLALSAHSGSATLMLDQPPPEDLTDLGNAPLQLGAGLIDEIDAANEEIWLISAYLIPTPELESAIERAEQRGVQVRALTNSIGSNNHLTAHSAYRKHIRRLLGMGVDLHELREDAEDRDLYIASPVDDKSLCLHAKVMIFDHDRVFIGSANLDPRSLHINTEMGLIIESASLNDELRRVLEPDFSERNAWRLKLDADQKITWISGDETLRHQPTHSFMRRIEDWFFTLLPIEDEM